MVTPVMEFFMGSKAQILVFGLSRTEKKNGGKNIQDPPIFVKKIC